MTRITFSSWSPSDRAFRSDLYVYNIQDSDLPEAARKADEYGGDYILMFEHGENPIIIHRLNNFCLTPPGFFGESYALMKCTAAEFLESLEDYRVIEEIYTQYSLRKRGEEEV